MSVAAFAGAGLDVEAVRAVLAGRGLRLPRVPERPAVVLAARSPTADGLAAGVLRPARGGGGAAARRARGRKARLPGRRLRRARDEARAPGRVRVAMRPARGRSLMCRSKVNGPGGQVPGRSRRWDAALRPNGEGAGRRPVAGLRPPRLEVVSPYAHCHRPDRLSRRSPRRVRRACISTSATTIVEQASSSRRRPSRRFAAARGAGDPPPVE